MFLNKDNVSKADFCYDELTLICATFAWTCATMGAVAQNPYLREKPHKKNALAHRFHRAAHYSVAPTITRRSLL
jgi:hypothetical protein